jgi:hypothetical protein
MLDTHLRWTRIYSITAEQSAGRSSASRGAGDVTVRNVTAVDPGAEGVVNGRFDGPDSPR